MEPEGSLPHSQVPATCPYSEPDRSSSCPPHRTSVGFKGYKMHIPETWSRGLCAGAEMLLRVSLRLLVHYTRIRIQHFKTQAVIFCLQVMNRIPPSL